MTAGADPYRTLEITAQATDAEVRAAYRRLVQRHHPDHNGGSAESAQRFEAVQEAYAEIRRRRQGSAPSPAADSGTADPDVDARLAEMERELKAARDARDRAARQARAAAASAAPRARAPARPSDEELGYVTTDDSFTKIVDDAAAELWDRWSEARHSPRAHRVSDLIDDLASRLTGEHDDDSGGRR